MFGFIDSASDHAAALSHFHSYVCFFLVLVVVFVIWLLKMILKFVVLERDLRVFNKSTATFFGVEIPHLNFFFSVFSALLSVKGLFQIFSDIFFAALATLNVTKVFYSYGINKTIYPDLGSKINVFSTLPALIPTSKAYVRPYSVGSYLASYLASRDAFNSSVLRTFRGALHDVPFLFPYERVEIKSYGPYTSVEQFITLYLFTTSYVLKLKHVSWSKISTDKN